MAAVTSETRLDPTDKRLEMSGDRNEKEKYDRLQHREGL